MESGATWLPDFKTVERHPLFASSATSEVVYFKKLHFN